MTAAISPRSAATHALPAQRCLYGCRWVAATAAKDAFVRWASYWIHTVAAESWRLLAEARALDAIASPLLAHPASGGSVTLSTLRRTVDNTKALSNECRVMTGERDSACISLRAPQACGRAVP